MNIIGLDYGKRFIGVAVGETTSQIAHGLKTVPAKKGVPDWPSLDAIINEWLPAKIILGLPLNMDGTEQNISKAARKFKHNLEMRYQLPCILCDERLSTYQAKSLNTAAHKTQIDIESARIILQQWFNDHL
ncbi:MAG: Holliday junction resolvase RuvX [Pseudomonadota bacterium]|nr:Holliday junction resolvase RuvX [Pseudomonadota bacterium]